MTTVRMSPNIVVDIGYDMRLDAFMTKVSWTESVECGEGGGVQSGISASQILLAHPALNPAEIIFQEAVRVSFAMPERVRQEAGKAATHYGRGLRDGLALGDRAGTASPTSQHGTVEQFPETSVAVLETLLAEVELCEDDLQRSRLAGIAERLKRFVPAAALAPAPEVQSAS